MCRLVQMIASKTSARSARLMLRIVKPHPVVERRRPEVVLNEQRDFRHGGSLTQRPPVTGPSMTAGGATQLRY
jgi:hypothetical protein